jgi:hypothetical protein
MKYPVASLVGFMPQGYSIPQQIEKLETCNNCGENIVAFTSWKHFEAFFWGGRYHPKSPNTPQSFCHQNPHLSPLVSPFTIDQSPQNWFLYWAHFQAQS